jgi:hypothetical protein
MSIKLPVSSSIPQESGCHSHQFDKSSTTSLVSTIDSDSTDSYGEETIVFDDHSHCNPLFPDDGAVTGLVSTDTAMDFGSLVDWDTVSAGEVEIVFYSDNDTLSEAGPDFGVTNTDDDIPTDCDSDLASISKVAPNDGESVHLVTQNFVVGRPDGDLVHALLLNIPVDFYHSCTPDSSHIPYFDVVTHSICKARDFGFKSVRFKSAHCQESIEAAASLASFVPSASPHAVPWLHQALPVPQVPTVGTHRFGFKDRNEEHIGSEGDVDDSLSVDIIMRQSAACSQDQVLQPCMGSDNSSHL